MKQLKYLSQDEYNKQSETYIKNHSQNKDYKIISLGWDCFSRTLPTWYGLKPTKDKGELSHPFDLAMHTLPNIIKILQNHFADYLDNVYYDEATQLWINNKYHIKYNHDNGLSLDEFKNRYTKRIENFYQTIHDAKNVFFIYHALNDDKQEDILQLVRELQNICDKTHFHLIVISHKWKKLLHCQNITLCYQPYPWKNYSWWENDHLTSQGVKFEHAIIDKLLKIIQKKLQQQSNIEQKIKYQRLLIHVLTGVIPLKKWRRSFRKLYMPKPAVVRSYDLIIPLGENCACATLLKQANLRKFSLPFDWTGLENEKTDLFGGLETKCNLILNDCKDIFLLDDLIEIPEKCNNPTYRYILNQRTGLRYIHEFPLDKSINEFYPQVLQKYYRRIERMYQYIKSSKNVLFIFNRLYWRKVDTLDFHIKTTELLAKFKKKWPHKNFSFLIFLHNEEITATEYYEKHNFPHITYVYLNNKWPHKDSYTENEWLGNGDVILKYLKKHINLT